MHLKRGTRLFYTAKSVLRHLDTVGEPLHRASLDRSLCIKTSLNFVGQRSLPTVSTLRETHPHTSRCRQRKPYDSCGLASPGSPHPNIGER